MLKEVRRTDNLDKIRLTGEREKIEKGQLKFERKQESLLNFSKFSEIIDDSKEFPIKRKAAWNKI